MPWEKPCVPYEGVMKRNKLMLEHVMLQRINDRKRSNSTQQRRTLQD